MTSKKNHFHDTVIGPTSVGVYNNFFSKIHYHNTPYGPTLRDKFKKGHNHRLRYKYYSFVLGDNNK